MCVHVYVCLYECVCVPYVFEWGPVCVYACRADPLQLVCVCAALTLSSGWVCLCVFVCVCVCVCERGVRSGRASGS